MSQKSGGNGPTEAATIRMATCQNCGHAEKMAGTSDRLLYRCRRYPGKPFLVAGPIAGGEPGVITVWPVMGTEDYCGEWEQADRPPLRAV